MIHWLTGHKGTLDVNSSYPDTLTLNGSVMKEQLNQLFSEFESGRLTRRQIIGQLALLFALSSGVRRIDAQESDPSDTKKEADDAPLFEATELNHIALRVTDVPRSREFYMQKLGLKLSRESASSAFLTCGQNFVALFEGAEARMDHYCYSVKHYDAVDAEKKLRADGLADIRRSGNRLYFSDPDGLTVQLAATSHLLD